MAEISGKFQLSHGDEDNFDKIMAAAGNIISIWNVLFTIK